MFFMYINNSNNYTNGNMGSNTYTSNVNNNSNAQSIIQPTTQPIISPTTQPTISQPSGQPTPQPSSAQPSINPSIGFGVNYHDNDINMPNTNNTANHNINGNVRKAKYQTAKQLIEFVDCLDLYDKFQINALDYSNGTGDKTVKATAYIDRTIILYLCNCILGGRYPATVKQATEQGQEIFLETKIKPKNHQTSAAPCTQFGIYRNGPTMRIPYALSVVTGTGDVKYRENGGSYLAPNSFKQISKIRINISQFDLEKMLEEIRYIIQSHQIENAVKNK